MSPVFAEGLGVSVKIGGISAGVSVGRGSIASADVNVGGSHGGNAVSAGVSVGSGSNTGGGSGSGSNSGGGTGSENGSGGHSGGSSGGGGASGGTDDNAFAATNPDFRVAPPVFPTGDIIGTTVWTRDNVLVGIVTGVRPGPDDNLMLSVEIVDNFGITQNVVIFQIGAQTVTEGRLTLKMMRNELIARLA
ncbi:hypothetical protein [Yoonia vestfoldensis]|uniref:hypothetical protein n=1 Tax=Yoonia vestfoldensis TaxID=245188 RepID=UPI001B7FC7D4|nr:hypothetical protein [Yoonia vestfoldensis]